MCLLILMPRFIDDFVVLRVRHKPSRSSPRISYFFIPLSRFFLLRALPNFASFATLNEKSSIVLVLLLILLYIPFFHPSLLPCSDLAFSPPSKPHFRDLVFFSCFLAFVCCSPYPRRNTMALKVYLLPLLQRDKIAICASSNTCSFLDICVHMHLENQPCTLKNRRQGNAIKL